MSLSITLERLHGLGLVRLFDALTCRAAWRYPWQARDGVMMPPEALAGVPPECGALRYDTHYEMALHYKCPCGDPDEWLRLSFVVSSELESNACLAQDAMLKHLVIYKANLMAEAHEARAALRKHHAKAHAPDSR